MELTTTSIPAWDGMVRRRNDEEEEEEVAEIASRKMDATLLFHHAAVKTRLFSLSWSERLHQLIEPSIVMRSGSRSRKLLRAK